MTVSGEEGIISNSTGKYTLVYHIQSNNCALPLKKLSFLCLKNFLTNKENFKLFAFFIHNQRKANVRVVTVMTQRGEERKESQSLGQQHVVIPQIPII